MATKAYPWHVELEQFIALEVKPTPKLIGVAKQLAVRLGKSSGHKEAKLYLDWAHKQGRAKVEKWWAKHGG